MKKGFTLVEMFVILFIIGLVSAMTVSVFQSGRKNKNVNAVVNAISNKIMEARGLAITPDENISGAAKFKITITSTAITGQYLDSSNGNIGAEKTIYKIPDGYTINPDPKEFSFNVKEANEIGTINNAGKTSFDISANDVVYAITIDNLSGNVTYERRS